MTAASESIVHHRLDLPRLHIRARLAALAAVIARAAVAVAGAATGLRSSAMITVGMALIAVAIGGLAGIWWGVGAGGIALLALDWAMTDPDQ